MGTAGSEYQDIALDECLGLLGAHHFGRIGLVVDGRPMIFPVNYALAGDTVVFRTNEGTKLDAAAIGPVVFEVDGIDEADRAGWSVIVTGFGNEITGALDEHAAQMRELEVQPWAPGGREHWVQILPESVTGRRVRSRAVVQDI